MQEERKKREIANKYYNMVNTACNEDKSTAEEAEKILKELETKFEKKDFEKGYAETEWRVVKEAIESIKGIEGATSIYELGCLKRNARKAIDRKYEAITSRGDDFRLSGPMPTKEDYEIVLKELKAILAKGEFAKGYEEYEKSVLEEEIKRFERKLGK